MLSHRLAMLTVSLFAGSVPVSAQPAPATQAVTVWSYGFNPRALHLAVGKPVTLVFVNRSSSSHDFTAKRFFETSVIQAGAAPNGEIELGPRETRSITLVPRAGIYHAHCSHFFHKQMGMSDEILVD